VCREFSFGISYSRDLKAPAAENERAVSVQSVHRQLRVQSGVHYRLTDLSLRKNIFFENDSEAVAKQK
jgi:hypothetical protein